MIQEKGSIFNDEDLKALRELQEKRAEQATNNATIGAFAHEPNTLQFDLDSEIVSNQDAVPAQNHIRSGQVMKIQNSGFSGQFAPDPEGEKKPDLNYDPEMLDPDKNFTQEQLREAVASAQAKRKQQREEDLQKDQVINLHSKSVIAPPKFIFVGGGNYEAKYFNYLNKIVEDAKANPPLTESGQVIRLNTKQIHDQRVMLLLTQIARDIKRYKSLTIKNVGPVVHRKLDIAKVVREVVDKQMDYLSPAAGYYAEAAKEA